MAPAAYVAEDGLVDHHGRRGPWSWECWIPSVGESLYRELGMGGLVCKEREKGKGVFRRETRKRHNIWHLKKRKYLIKKRLIPLREIFKNCTIPHYTQLLSALGLSCSRLAPRGGLPSSGLLSSEPLLPIQPSTPCGKVVRNPLNTVNQISRSLEIISQIYISIHSQFTRWLHHHFRASWYWYKLPT